MSTNNTIITLLALLIVALIWISGYIMALLDINSWIRIPLFLTTIIIEVIFIIAVACYLVDDINRY